MKSFALLPSAALVAITACRSSEGVPSSDTGAATSDAMNASVVDTIVDFRGIGQEPGWILQIVRGREMRFSYDYGERTVATPVPTPTDSAGTQVWHVITEANDLRVVVVPTRCEDVMSGKPFPATVTVTLNGQAYRGCGGPPD